MFLEAQFGPAITPLRQPRLKLGLTPSLKLPSSAAAAATENNDDDDDIKTETGSTPNVDDDDEETRDLADLEAEEMERLHAIGIPVPGVEIRVDKHVARVWLETLEVECEYGVLRDRVRAVVERAVETVAPLWGRKW